MPHYELFTCLYNTPPNTLPLQKAQGVVCLTSLALFFFFFFWKGRGSTKVSQGSVAHIEISTAILRPSRRDRSIPVTENCPHKHF